jgi:hypothetical protein
MIHWLRKPLLVLGAIALALVWVLLSAQPAFAEDGKLTGYTHAQLAHQDFSNQDLSGGNFVSSDQIVLESTLPMPFSISTPSPHSANELTLLT